MSDGRNALVVDDDEEWLSIFRNVLQPDFNVIEARNTTEVSRILENRNITIHIAIVDIRLYEGKKGKHAGLDVLFMLRQIAVPCIVATEYEEATIIRDAFVLGGAKDIWFKGEKVIILRSKIKEVLSISQNETDSIVETSSFRGEFWRLVFALIIIPVAVFSLLIVLVNNIPTNFILTTIGGAVTLILGIFAYLALFYNRITGDQLIKLLRKTSENGENESVGK